MTARIAGFDSRADLDLALPKSVSRRISPGTGGRAAHYGEPAQRLTGGHDQCRRRWQEWQSFHMGPQRGWSDIAYTGDSAITANALAGRGFGVRAATTDGVDSANNTFYAFCAGWAEKASSRPARRLTPSNGGCGRLANTAVPARW